MSFDSNKYHRRSIRLPGYDYSQVGAYFITICAKYRECIFGEIIDGEMQLNEMGELVQYEWYRSADIRCEITLDTFVIMPNHIHGIIHINNSSNPVGAHGHAPLHRKPRSLGSFIAGYKSVTTKRINQIRGFTGHSIWQRNYYEHVIRNDADLKQIRKYIVRNPANWSTDEENPINKP